MSRNNTPSVLLRNLLFTYFSLPCRVLSPSFLPIWTWTVAMQRPKSRPTSTQHLLYPHIYLYYWYLFLFLVTGIFPKQLRPPWVLLVIFCGRTNFFSINWYAYKLHHLTSLHPVFLLINKIPIPPWFETWSFILRHEATIT